MVRRSVPITHPEVWEDTEPYSARLRWHRAYIPQYYSTRPHRYRIEMQEAGSSPAMMTSDDNWRPIASGVDTTEYVVPDISPRKDYNFRIRAELENGDVSEPTPPIQYHRTKLPMKKESYALSEFKPYQEVDAVTGLNRPYIDHLTKYVPPRLPIDKPDMVSLSPENVELSWKPAREPDAIKGVSNLTYTIEVRNPPSFDWRELVSGLKTRTYLVDNLHPKNDYCFRVRAINKYGNSEPSLPVSLYRPKARDDYDEDDEWEREFQAKFGVQALEDEPPIEQVPPKLPMDTPETVTQSPESIWLRWQPARIPAYATKTPITYVIEMKEPPSTNWRRDVTGLVDCQYVRDGLNPLQDYHIRVRAESEFGISEPTLPIIIQRSRSSRPGSRLSSMEREERELALNTSVIDNLTSGVPPRMASSRPLASNSRPEGFTLSWSACRVPSYVKKSNVVYIIEKREPPGHIWSVFARDIKDTKYNVTGLNPDQDYLFRVRAKNEYGTSDPSLPLTVYRERDDYVPQRIRSRSGSRDSLSSILSVHKRRSMSIDYDSISVKSDEDYKLGTTVDKTPVQPEYVETTYDTQYGVEGRKGKISLKVKAYPVPTVLWYLGDEKLEMGDKYSTSVSPQGEITLEIKNVSPDSAGVYKCYAENASGAAAKLVTFKIVESPTVLEPLQDIVVKAYENVTLRCRAEIPQDATVKWQKDWRPLADSSRVKMTQVGPDTYVLEISNVVPSDGGVYACMIENMAGKVTLTSRITVEEDVPVIPEVNLKSGAIEDYYHVLEEIGRGQHGVVRRAIEMTTGKRYAANFMYLRNRAQKNFFLSELEALRAVCNMDGVLRLHDAFETERGLIFVTEILDGPELLLQMVADGNWTEARVAGVVKKLLTTLKQIQGAGIMHLDIKPSNIRLCGPNNDDVKLINFALARFLHPEEDVMHNYGSVGFASPEQINNDVLNLKTDMWAVGVLTYVLLSGELPFQGDNDAAILNATVEKTCKFGEKEFAGISKEAKDFIKKLIVKNKKERMSVDDSLAHPWLSTTSAAKISTDRLKNYYNTDKLKREANKLYTTAYLQSLMKLQHGTAALYQPAIDVDTGEIIFPDSDDYGDYLDEDSWYEWQLQYLDDPDSQQFPLKDKKFTVRESKHAAADTDAGRKEEEKEAECESLAFINKIENTSFELGENATFTCSLTSKKDTPVVTWYREDTLLTDQYRNECSFDEETGIATLTVVNAKDYDTGVYKCVARNKEGRISCQARLLLGERPGHPGRPVVTQTSATEVFLTWTGPVSDGNSYILGYRVDYKKLGDDTWTRGPCVTEEYALVSGLVPSSTYIFRVSCHNKYGTSPYSWASLEANTCDTGIPVSDIAIYKNGTKVESGDRCQLTIDEDLCTLKITSAVADDNAIYSVRVGDSSTDEGGVRVKVSKPKEVKKPEPEKKAVEKVEEKATGPVEVLVEGAKVRAKEGEKVKLDWKITGVKPKDIRIFKNGKQIKPDKSYKLLKDGNVYTLMVTSATQSDNADFTVRISKTDETDLGKITVKIGEEEEVVEEVTEKVEEVVVEEEETVDETPLPEGRFKVLAANAKVQEGETIELKWQVPKGAPKISFGLELQPLLQFTTFEKQQLILPAESRRSSLTSGAEEAQIKQANPEEDYTFGDVLSKGNYGEYRLVASKADNKPRVMKIVPYTEETQDKVTREFNLLKHLRQAHVISVCNSYVSGDNFYMTFENLSGMNIVQYLCIRKFYNEELVAGVVNQILEALQYLHHMDIVHCNLQPSSIVMATLRRPHVKLRDFTLAQKIQTSQQRLDMVGYPDFVAPEVIKMEPAGFCPDLWAVGVLAFIMLSGVSPFGGDSLKDTLSNIMFDRYCMSDLHDNVTKDAAKFVSKLLKRLPKNRASIPKCLTSRWLKQSDSMVKAQQKARFSTARLRDFSNLYLQRRADPEYMNLAGISLTDLPKPTKGPAKQPVLSDRVVNRNVVNIRVSESKSASPAEPIAKENDDEKPTVEVQETEMVPSKEPSTQAEQQTTEQVTDNTEKPEVAKEQELSAQSEQQKSEQVVDSQEKPEVAKANEPSQQAKQQSSEQVADDADKSDFAKAQETSTTAEQQTSEQVADEKDKTDVTKVQEPSTQAEQQTSEQVVGDKEQSESLPQEDIPVKEIIEAPEQALEVSKSPVTVEENKPTSVTEKPIEISEMQGKETILEEEAQTTNNVEMIQRQEQADIKEHKLVYTQNVEEEPIQETEEVNRQQEQPLEELSTANPSVDVAKPQQTSVDQTDALEQKAETAEIQEQSVDVANSPKQSAEVSEVLEKFVKFDEIQQDEEVIETQEQQGKTSEKQQQPTENVISPEQQLDVQEIKEQLVEVEQTKEQLAVLAETQDKPRENTETHLQSVEKTQDKSIEIIETKEQAEQFAVENEQVSKDTDSKDQTVETQAQSTEAVAKDESPIEVNEMHAKQPGVDKNDTCVETETVSSKKETPVTDSGINLETKARIEEPYTEKEKAEELTNENSLSENSEGKTCDEGVLIKIDNEYVDIDKAILELSQKTVENVLKQALEQVKAEVAQSIISVQKESEQISESVVTETVEPVEIQAEPCSVPYPSEESLKKSEAADNFEDLVEAQVAENIVSEETTTVEIQSIKPESIEQELETQTTNKEEAQDNVPLDSAPLVEEARCTDVVKSDTMIEKNMDNQEDVQVLDEIDSSNCDQADDSLDSAKVEEPNEPNLDRIENLSKDTAEQSEADRLKEAAAELESNTKVTTSNDNLENDDDGNVDKNKTSAENTSTENEQSKESMDKIDQVQNEMDIDAKHDDATYTDEKTELSNEEIIEEKDLAEEPNTESKEPVSEIVPNKDEPNEEEVERLMTERAILEDAMLFC